MLPPNDPSRTGSNSGARKLGVSMGNAHKSQGLNFGRRMFYYTDKCDKQQRDKWLSKAYSLNDWTMIKYWEGFGALLSFVALGSLWFFTTRTHYNVVGVDKQNMLICEYDVNGKTHKFTGSDVHDKVKIKDWLENCEDSGFLNGHGAAELDHFIETNFKKTQYPGLVLAYDVVTIFSGFSSTEAHSAMYESSLNYTKTVQQTCHNRQHVYLQQEEWGDRSFVGLNVGTGRYEVRIWTLLAIVFVVSGCFQLYRFLTYASHYRPTGPDFGRWVEYLLTSPLQIFIIAMSVLVRDTFLLVTLTFLQAALILLGYLLELCIQDYVDLLRFQCFAKHLKEQFGHAIKHSLRSANPNMENLIKPPSDDTIKLLQMIGIFMNEEDDPEIDHASEKNPVDLQSLTLDALRQRNLLMWQKIRVSCVFLFSWSVWGVIFTLLLGRLSRQGHIIADCYNDKASPDRASIPGIAWAIVITQAFLFAGFGINLSVLWIRIWLYSYSDDQCAAKSEPPDTQVLIGNKNDVSTQIQKSDSNIYAFWLQHTFVFSILNVVCKTLLEILLFFYAAMVTVVT